jgi:hypothetical protein
MTPKTATDTLADAALEIAVKAAARHIKRNHLHVSDSCLCENLKVQIKAALPGALADAQAALACGMIAVAEQTFAASIALAGVEAAKRSVTSPPEPKPELEPIRRLTGVDGRVYLY